MGFMWFQKWYEFPKPLLALRCVNIQEAIKEAFDALTDTRITPYSHSFFKDITCSTTISRMSVRSELSQTFFVNSLRKDASDVCILLGLRMIFTHGIAIPVPLDSPNRDTWFYATVRVASMHNDIIHIVCIV